MFLGPQIYLLGLRNISWAPDSNLGGPNRERRSCSTARACWRWRRPSSATTSSAARRSSWSPRCWVRRRDHLRLPFLRTGHCEESVRNSDAGAERVGGALRCETAVGAKPQPAPSSGRRRTATVGGCGSSRGRCKGRQAGRRSASGRASPRGSARRAQVRPAPRSTQPP